MFAISNKVKLQWTLLNVIILLQSQNDYNNQMFTVV
jgi:hypothetical protein